MCWQVTEYLGRGRRLDGAARNIEKFHFLNGVSTRSSPCSSSSSSSQALRRCKNEEPKFEHVFEPHCLSRDMLVLCAPVNVHVQPHPSRRSSFEYSPGICVHVGTSCAHAWLPCLSTSEPLGMLDNVDGAWSAAVLSGANLPHRDTCSPCRGQEGKKKKSLYQ